MKHDQFFDNPAITEPRFLFAQVTEVEQTRRGTRDLTTFELRVEPAVPDHGSSYLYSTLYHTDNAERIWMRCRRAFGFEDYDAVLALGRWGKIYLVPSSLQGSDAKYSTVQYVNQTTIDRAKVQYLTDLTGKGVVPWDAKDTEEAQQRIEEALSHL